MVSLLVIVIQCALAAVVARVVYLCHFHPLARYPGPWFARFTNIWRFITFLDGNHHIIEQRLHERYGRVVRVAPNWLSFSSLEDFEAIYGFHKAIEKSDFYIFGRKQTTNGSRSIFSTKDEATHRAKKRKMLGPALISTKVAAYKSVVRKHVDVLISRAESSGPGAGTQEKANMAPLVHRYTVDSMLEVLYGPNLTPNQQPYTDNPAGEGLPATLRSLSKTAWSYSLWPVYGWLMNTRLANTIQRRLSARGTTPTGMAALLPTIQSIVFARAEETIQSPQPGIVKNWLQIPPDDARRMDSREILTESANMVIAGPGSTAAAITAVLYHLGTEKGQIWQDKLREEAAGTTSNNSSHNDTFLNAVIKETLRLNAAFATAFPRVITPGAETVLCAATSAPLPIGTTVSANTFVLGRSHEIWGDDADDWLPQRWTDSTEATAGSESGKSESQRREMEARLVAFSKGARGCVGRDLGMLVIGQAVMGFVEKWRFRSVGELKGKSYIEMQYDDCWIQCERLVG